MVNPARKPKLGTVVAVALGGVMGALARVYLPWPSLTTLADPGDPLPTLIINIIGAVLLGFISGYGAHRNWPEPVEKGLTVGVLGSFTTMSALALAASVLLVGATTAAAGTWPTMLGRWLIYLVALIGFLGLTTILTMASYRLGQRKSAP